MQLRVGYLMRPHARSPDCSYPQSSDHYSYGSASVGTLSKDVCVITACIATWQHVCAIQPGILISTPDIHPPISTALQGCRSPAPRLQPHPTMSVAQNAQGHTPHDRLSYLVNQLCAQLDGGGGGNAPAEALALARQAKAVIDGYDAYVGRMSSPHPAVVDTMIAAGNARDWERVHREGKTRFRLIPEMSAGGYEAVVLQQLAKLAKVCVPSRVSWSLADTV